MSEPDEDVHFGDRISNHHYPIQQSAIPDWLKYVAAAALGIGGTYLAQHWPPQSTPEPPTVEEPADLDLQEPQAPDLTPITGSNETKTEQLTIEAKVRPPQE